MISRRLLIASISLLFAACASPSGTSPEALQKEAQLTSIAMQAMASSARSLPANYARIGEPCTVGSDTTMDTKGLQCHWSYTGTGEWLDHGVWVLPNPASSLRFDFPYGDITKTWKSYTSQDGSFTVKVPPMGGVSDFTWQNPEYGNLRLFSVSAYDDPTHDVVNFEIVDEKADPMENRIAALAKKGSASRREDMSIGDVPAVSLSVAAKSTEGSGGFTAIFIPRGNTYLFITAPEAGGYSSFMYAAIISSVRFR